MTEKIIACLIAFFALIPPIQFSLSIPTQYWPMAVILSLFSLIYFLQLNVNLIVKVFVLYLITNAFLSSAPFISFTNIIIINLCAYFYFLCHKINNYKIIFKFLLTIVALNSILLIFQYFGKDSLLNWGRATDCYGLVGWHMQTASFAAILSACLFPVNIMFFVVSAITAIICNSLGTILSSAGGILTYLFLFNKYAFWRVVPIFIMLSIIIGVKQNKFKDNILYQNGRLNNWSESINIANSKKWNGWGIGMYQYIYPAMTKIDSVPWKTAHNDFIQNFFEIGYIGIGLIALYIVQLMNKLKKCLHRKLLKRNAVVCLSGLSVIFIEMSLHFPQRMIQCVLLLIFFLSYCERITSYVKQN